MDRLDTLRLFTRIVERGSFSQAAAELGIPRATATHAIKALEQRLGARLLERTTRQVRPTLDGRAFHERCQRILADLEEAEGALSMPSADPHGTLRVDLQGSHASLVILPRIAEFHRRYPRIALRISSGDRLVDLLGEDIDCVVRAGQPRDSSLVARRLAALPEVICASPDYLERAGSPRHPDELLKHQAVGFFSTGSDNRYPFTLEVDGAVREYPAAGWITVSDAAHYSLCALQGCGLIQVPRYHVEDYLRDGRLRQVLGDWPCPALPVSVLYPYHRQLSPRVQVFVEWLVALYAERFPD